MSGCTCSNAIRISSKFSICMDIFFPSKRKALGLVDAPSHVNADGTMEERVDALGFSEQPATPYWLVYLAFVLCGVGISLVWGAVSFNVVYWSAVYDKDIFRLLVAAYNVPGLITLIVQLATDAKVDACVGKRRAYVVRGCAALLMCAALLFVGPLLQLPQVRSKNLMVLYTVLVGFAVGASHGWLYSVAAVVHKKAISCLLVGGGMATFILLGFSFAVPIDAKSSAKDLYPFFWPLGVITIVSAVAFVMICTSNIARITIVDDNDGDKALDTTGDKRTSSQRFADEDLLQSAPHSSILDDFDEYVEPNWGAPDSGSTEGVALLGSTNVDDPHAKAFGGTNHDGVPQSGDNATTKESLWQLQKRTWPSCVSIFLNLMSVVGLTGLAANIPSSSGNSKLPTYVLYATSVAQFLGSETSIFLKVPKTQYGLFLYSALRYFLFPATITYVIGHKLNHWWINDAFTLVLMSLVFYTSAISTNKCYGIGIGSAGPENSANVSLLINVWLYSGVLAGLSVPFWLNSLVDAVK